MVLADRKLKLREIADTLKISECSVFTILHENLSIRKALFEMGTAFVRSQSKTITSRRFRALFGATSAQLKGFFHAVCDNK